MTKLFSFRSCTGEMLESEDFKEFSVTRNYNHSWPRHTNDLSCVSGIFLLFSTMRHTGRDHFSEVILFLLSQFPGIAAVEVINQAVDEGEPNGTLAALKMPTAQLQNVDNKQAVHYQNLLASQKKRRAQVKSHHQVLFHACSLTGFLFCNFEKVRCNYLFVACFRKRRTLVLFCGTMKSKTQFMRRTPRHWMRTKVRLRLLRTAFRKGLHQLLLFQVARLKEKRPL